MKNLSELLNYKTFSVSMVGLGFVLIGTGASFAKDSVEKGNFETGLGVIISTLGGAYYLGREDEKRANKKNYQTKPEDYQNK